MQVLTTALSRPPSPQVSAASPEVIERINSLGEAHASLHLMETGEGSLGAHAAFRCFATATTRRGSTHTLSEAFRNRTLILQCEPLDAGLSSHASAHHGALPPPFPTGASHSMRG